MNGAEQGQSPWGRIFNYLDGLKHEERSKADPLAGQAVVNAIKVLFSLLLNVPAPIPDPDVCPGERNVMFTWDLGPHHLECEILPEGEVEWFYLNHETDETWDCEATVENAITEGVIEKLQIFKD